MFRRIDADGQGPTGRLTFDGQAVDFHDGDSVAAALVADGHVDFRTAPVDGATRGPYCMMGVCFDCLVEIDGVASRQACLTPARDGMVVRRQQGSRSLA